MADYMIHILDDAGRIMANRGVKLANDTQALAAAMIMLAEGARAEVWGGLRYVGQ